MEQLQTLKNEDSVTQNQKNLLEPKRSPWIISLKWISATNSQDRKKTKKQHPSFVLIGWKTNYRFTH